MKDLLKDKNGANSSKRVIGVILFAYVVALHCITTMKGLEISANSLDLLKTFLYTGGVLLGIGVFENKK